VTRVTAMDYDRFCVEEMMPAVFERFGAPAGKIRRALGSYNRIPDRNFYDLVIAVGALHHAEVLAGAFRESYSALKPGGIFLVSDVCEFDHVGNRELSERYEAPVPNSEARYGRDVKVKDNGDHWYRLSEWLAASRTAGFEALPFLFDAEFGEPADDGIFAEPALWRGFQIRSFQPYFSDRGYCDSLVMILQKPALDGSTDAIPKAVATQHSAASASGSFGGREIEKLRTRLAAAEAEVERLKERSLALKEKLERQKQAGSGGIRSLLRRLVG
jgi:SAM-dependent methyltransferase